MENLKGLRGYTPVGINGQLLGRIGCFESKRGLMFVLKNKRTEYHDEETFAVMFVGKETPESVVKLRVASLYQAQTPNEVFSLLILYRIAEGFDKVEDWFSEGKLDLKKCLHPNMTYPKPEQRPRQIPYHEVLEAVKWGRTYV